MCKVLSWIQGPLQCPSSFFLPKPCGECLLPSPPPSIPIPELVRGRFLDEGDMITPPIPTVPFTSLSTTPTSRSAAAYSLSADGSDSGIWCDGGPCAGAFWERKSSQVFSPAEPADDIAQKAADQNEKKSRANSVKFRTYPLPLDPAVDPLLRFREAASGETVLISQARGLASPMP